MLFKSLMMLLLGVWVSESFAINNLGEAAEGLMGPVGVVTMLMELACYIIGTAFCIGALMQYRIHRQNPKLTPLMTPVVMLIVGVLLILVPYFSILPGDSFNASEQRKRETAAVAEVIREYNAQRAQGDTSEQPPANPAQAPTPQQAPPQNPNEYWQ